MGMSEQEWRDLPLEMWTVEALRAEVERQRAIIEYGEGVAMRLDRKVRAQEAENAALRQIALEVVDAPNATMHMAQGDWAVCPFRCGAQDAAMHGVDRAVLHHTSKCPMTRFRALLGETQDQKASE